MVPSSPPRRRRNSSKVNLLISLTFHAAIVATLAYFAAREGLLGKELRKIAVQMVKEKPPEPEKPKEPEPEPEKPPVSEEPAEPPPPAVEAAASPPDAPPPTTPANVATAPPAVPAIAPPANALPAFVFGGGRAVSTSSDPVEVYRGLVEYALRSKWTRPDDVDDRFFVAEVDVAIDRAGRLGDHAWKKGSGHERWDASVRAAIAATPALTRPPPTNFPPRVLVRFDVQEVADATTE